MEPKYRSKVISVRFFLESSYISTFDLMTSYFNTVHRGVKLFQYD